VKKINMQILQIVPHYVPAYRFGGPIKVAHLLGKAFAESGHSVTVCTTNMASENSNLDVPVGLPVTIDGVNVYYEPVILSRYWGFSPALFRRIRTEIKDTDVVLIHAHYQFANWIGAYLARRYHKPYVIFAHSSLRREAINHKNGFLKRLYLRIMEHNNLRKALFIAFNATEEKSNSLYQEMGRVIFNGIDISEFSNMPQGGYFQKLYPELQNKFIFLFLGRLDVKHKGLDLLIPAFAKLHREYPDTHLVLAGPDEEGGKNEVIAMGRQHGVVNSITLPGLISGQVKLAALQDADAFVLPSRFEGLSIALLEALYIGLPMLVTDKVGLCEEIRDTGAGIVVPVLPSEIYDGLLKLTDKDARMSMKGKGTELILGKYTWDKIAQNLVEQIQELIR
jgi:glycosyltransferase involved in cell wall biosynthesis